MSDAASSKIFRLLVVAVDTYPPTRVDVSVLFGDELSARGHRIDWILQSEAPCEKAYRTPWGSGTVWVGPTDTGTSLLNRLRKHIRSIAHDFKLFSLLRGGKYDCIEVKDKFIAGVFAVIASRLYRKRFVYWLSYPFPEEYLWRANDPGARYPFLYRIRGASYKFMLYRILLPAADHVFVQSEEMQRQIARLGVPMEKMTPVPMGISVEHLKPRPERTGRTVIPAGEKCFLYLGALDRVRRLDLLIRVLAKVREEIPDAKLYLVGKGDDPSDEQMLVDEARRLNVEAAVVFVGQLPRAQALEYVQDADVCVSPIDPTPVFNVASPTKLVEYMAMGKAVVANDQPDQRLLIERSGGGYCVPWDEAAFARAIVAIMRAPDMARDMGERGRRYAVANRSYSIIADVVERDMLRAAAGPG